MTPELGRSRAEHAQEVLTATEGAPPAAGAAGAAASRSPLNTVNGPRTVVQAHRGSVYAPFIPPAKHVPAGAERGHAGGAPDAPQKPRKSPAQRVMERAGRDGGAARPKATKAPKEAPAAPPPPPLCDFERQREENMARNAAVIAGLGIAPLVPTATGRKRKGAPK